jgi:hypothetical protein
VWKHALELDGPRKGQRGMAIIYPKDLPQLEAALSSGDSSVDSVDGHPVAYEAILQASQSFENRPVFLKEASEQVVSDPFYSEKVPEWMAITKQVATGNRRRVLEDGVDKMNSDDEEDPNMKPDVEPNMYTEGMDPLKGPIQLTQSQVAAQKAAAHALKALPRSQAPMPTGSSDDDDPNGSQYIWSTSKGIFRKNKKWRDPNVLALPAPEPDRKPTPVSSDTEDQGEMSEDQKRLARIGKKKATATRKASAAQPVPEAKASSPVKVQESRR